MTKAVSPDEVEFDLVLDDDEPEKKPKEFPPLPTVLVTPEDKAAFYAARDSLRDEFRRQVADGLFVEAMQNAPRKPRKKKKIHPAKIEAKRKKRIFLSVLAETASVTESAKAAGYLSVQGVYHQRRVDPKFKEAWDQALEAAGDMLESEAVRRAVKGTYEPVFYKGELVGYKKNFSDGLLQTLLKGAKPDKFAERKKVDNNHSGNIGIAVLPATISIDDWENAARQVHNNQKMIDVTAEVVEVADPEPKKADTISR